MSETTEAGGMIPGRDEAQNISFIDTFLGTLVAPVQTFNQLASDCRSEVKHLPGAMCIIALVFTLDALRLTPLRDLSWALVSIPGELSGGFFLWLLAAATVSLTALCFGQEGYKARAAFVTLAWSFLPWIFLGPISCFWKVLGPAHVLFMAVPLVWILVLQIIAVKSSFEMKAWQSLALVLLVPPLLSWFQLLQFMQALTATLGSLI